MDIDMLSVFGLKCRVKDKRRPKGLQVYMSYERKFYDVFAEGFSFVIVDVGDEERFGSVALKKQLIKYREVFGSEVAFSFAKITKPQRDSLIKRQIPFVSGEDQLYLPFLGISLRNNLVLNKSFIVEKMSPVTQTLFLYLLYHSDEKIIKKRAAEFLGVAKMSVTRASEQLNALGLINEEYVGKEIVMRPVRKGKEYYDMAKEYLINPIQKEIFIDCSLVNKDFIDAGETALANVSMLSYPNIREMAVYKADVDKDSLREIDIRWEDVDAVRLQLWKYDPHLFVKEGAIDPISLALSLKDSKNERVEGELAKYLGGYKW